MNPILKKNLPETVAAELRQRIERGAIQGKLPGVRLLARSLGVSVPTICQALHVLNGQGLLDAGGKRRRWVVSGNTKETGETRPMVRASHHKRSGRLLFLSSQPLGSERHSGVEVFAELLDLLGIKGWEVMHRVVDFN